MKNLKLLVLGLGMSACSGLVAMDDVYYTKLAESLSGRGDSRAPMNSDSIIINAGRVNKLLDALSRETDLTEKILEHTAELNNFFMYISSEENKVSLSGNQSMFFFQVAESVRHILEREISSKGSSKGVAKDDMLKKELQELRRREHPCKKVCEFIRSMSVGSAVSFNFGMKAARESEGAAFTFSFGRESTPAPVRDLEKGEAVVSPTLTEYDVQLIDLAALYVCLNVLVGMENIEAEVAALRAMFVKAYSDVSEKNDDPVKFARLLLGMPSLVTLLS